MNDLLPTVMSIFCIFFNVWLDNLKEHLKQKVRNNKKRN